MPIFDEIGKKITQSTQSALKNTKDVADLSRLNTQIADEEKLIFSFYMQIGKKYYDLHGTEADEEFKLLCDSITETQERITELKIAVQEIKGFRRCSSCGGDVPIVSAFCGTCGHDTRNDPAIVEEEDIPKKCPNCGKVIAENMSFCTECGQKI